MTREDFHHKLDALDRDVVVMGRMVEQAVALAARALAEGDADLAAEVVGRDDQIDAMYLSIEEACYALLAQQQPVARDLRLIVAILRVTNDLERAGDLAVNLAKTVKRLTGGSAKPVAELTGKMGLEAAKLIDACIDAYEAKDLADADDLERKDDVIDALFGELIGELLALRGGERQEALQTAINMVLVGRYFERIADHAVAVGAWVKYFITGTPVGPR